MTSRLRSLSFFFNDTATTEIYTLSLHDALPILANLRRVVESHGAGLIDVVKTNVFLVSMDDFAVMNEEYAKVFGDEPPARSAVAVPQVPVRRLVEIEAWVHRPGH